MTSTANTARSAALQQVSADAPHVAEYEGWWQVPDGLLTKAQLADLEFPRRPTETPAGRVWSEDFRGRPDRLLVDLYRPEACLPTGASAAQLQAAAARSTTRSYQCAVCGCRPERTLDSSNPLCQVCSHIQRLQRQQNKARQAQRFAADRLAEAMTWPGAVVLHTTEKGQLTSSGRPRPPLSARISAVAAADGRKLLDVTVSLVTSPRARLRDPDATPAAEITDKVIAVLGGKPLICWAHNDIATLSRAVPYDWPATEHHTQRPRLVTIETWSTAWRAQLTAKGGPIPARHPGTADRLWLHLTRIVASADLGDVERTAGYPEGIEPSG
ncbi:hypothetical protein ACIA49_38515 [Kribbella sp. NPDC051587]|uniref:hypothetical protein n=1 Tax=Kribbella sp. NPDC051587 TaxID=3364119 RepID=UPI0037AB3BBD